MKHAQHLEPIKLREPVTLNLREPADLERLLGAIDELERTPAQKDFALRARMTRVRTDSREVA